jgi:hypothetical protein
VPDAPWRRRPDGSWRLEVAGSYRTGNDRSADVGPCATPATHLPDPDPAVLPLPTPTTPTTDGEEPAGIDPPWLACLTGGESTAVSLEYHWRGRLVHRASFQVVERYYETTPDWHHRSADHWDNCLDPDFLRFTGATDLLAPEEVYERDRRDWEADTWHHRR